MIAALTAALCVTCAAADAATAPEKLSLPARQIRVSAPSTGRPWHATRVGPHLFFGTIAALHGANLTIRLRSGRFALVDASAAIANGDYSAPLFVGKLVSIDGDLHGAMFTAAHVFRMDTLANVRADY